MTGIYELGGKRIGITSHFREVHSYCRAYRTEGAPDFCIKISPEDLAFERAKARREAAAEGRSCPEYTDAYLETLAVYRKIAERMPSYETVLLHGSCVAVDGCGYLFTAPSGTGKSTHTRLWCELFGERAVMVNDDKPLLKIGGRGITVYGTPWNGKHRRGSRMEVSLQGLCILTRAENNHIERITAADARIPLLQQLYRPADPEAMKQTLLLLERLLVSVPLYRLGCRPDPDAAKLAYEMMGEKSHEDKKRVHSV